MRELNNVIKSKSNKRFMRGTENEKYYRDSIKILDYTYEYYGDDSLNVT